MINKNKLCSQNNVHAFFFQKYGTYRIYFSKRSKKVVCFKQSIWLVQIYVQNVQLSAFYKIVGQKMSDTCKFSEKIGPQRLFTCNQYLWGNKQHAKVTKSRKNPLKKAFFWMRVLFRPIAHSTRLIRSEDEKTDAQDGQYDVCMIASIWKKTPKKA